MIKLKALHFDKIWGYEEWIASVHPGGRQEEFYDEVGKDYPLLVKIIEAKDSLSVQVHPDDQLARELEGEKERGKTECWYVLAAEEGAKLVYGLKGSYTTEELRQAIEEGRLEDYLNLASVKKGDFIFIPAGTVHAIGGGLRLLEVQQSCDITYRLYDWKRGRELHVEKSLQAIKNAPLPPIETFQKSFSCPYFQLNLVDSIEESGKESKDRLFFVLEAGDGAALSSDSGSYPLHAEDIFFIKAGESPALKGKAHLMEIKAQ